MAFISNTDDEDLKKQQAGGLNTSGIVSTSPTGAATTSGGAAGATDATKAPTSTGFVNLQSYLDANQGAGSKLAGDATKDLSNQVGTYGQTAANTVSGAKGGFDAATGDKQAGEIKSGLASDARGTAGKAGDFLKSGYDGPKASDYTGTLATTQGQLNSQLNGVDKASNQQDLLKQTYGANGNQYTNGFGQLDQFLIGGSDDGRNAINAVKAKTADVTGAYNGAVNQLTGMQAGAQQKLAANQAAVKGTAHDLFMNKDQGFANQVKQKNAGLQRDGMTGVVDYGAGDFATDNDKLDLQALSSLSGDSYDAGRYAQHGGSAGTALQQSVGQGISGGSGGGSPMPWFSDTFGAAAKAGKDTAQFFKTAGEQAAAAPHQNQAAPINVNPAGVVQSVAAKTADVAKDNKDKVGSYVSKRRPKFGN